jgi:hypothetical protein
MKHAVGLLFVHGIGEQSRGDTVISFGEPVVGWLDAWLRGHGRGSARFSAAELRSSARLGATAVIERKIEAGSVTAEWRLAESWWAGDFKKPPFTMLAGWLLSTGFWTVLSHAARSAFTRKGGWWLRVFDVVKIAAAIPAGWLLQIGVVLLALLAWVPIPKMRRALSALLLRISGTLGDSYILLESPLQAAAALSVTRRNIQRLADQCEKVVVVAHSQGAALAHGALQEGAPEQVKLLVTVGSGLAKLNEMKDQRTRRLAPTVRNMASISLLMVLLLPRALQIWRSNSGDVIWYYAGIPAMLLVAVLFSTWEHWKRLSQDLPPNLSIKPVQWWDVYATADPVPNGPLAAPEVAIECFDSLPVTNRMSVVSDHSSYWTNRDEFLPALLSRIDSALHCGLFDEADKVVFAQAAKQRRLRVWALVAVRAACFASVGLTLWAMRAVLHLQGAAILDAMNSVPLSRPVADLIVSAGLILKGIAVLLTGHDQERLVTAGHAAIAAFVPVLAVGLWYRFVAFVIWSAWDERQCRWLCDPGVQPAGRLDQAALPVAALAVGMVPAALAIAARWLPDYARLGLLAVDSVVTLPMLLMSLSMLGLVLGFVAGILSMVWKAIAWGARRIKGLMTRPKTDAGSRAAGA